MGVRTASAEPASTGWDTATTVMAFSAMGIELFSPRTFSSDPEVTTGWKARWHVSALAPIMTYATLAYLNEHNLKSSFAGQRPNCPDSALTNPACQSFGMFSTETFIAFSALGHGTGVFLADTLKWSHGEFHGGAFTLEVGVPFVLSVLTAVGRTAGDWESGGQVWGTAGVGLGVGLGLGVLYAMMQRPECGYTGNLICW